MKHKKQILVGILVVIFCTVGAAAFLTNRHEKIDAWSSVVTVEDIALAEVASGYGVDQRSYDITPEEYPELTAVLRTVTEKNSTRKKTTDSERLDYRLALYTHGKLWLFHCLEDKTVSLMFNDRETGAYFGCQGKLLYIDSPELWEYIVTLVDDNAK